MTWDHWTAQSFHPKKASENIDTSLWRRRQKILRAFISLSFPSFIAQSPFCYNLKRFYFHIELGSLFSAVGRALGWPHTTTTAVYSTLLFEPFDREKFYNFAQAFRIAFRLFCFVSRVMNFNYRSGNCSDHVQLATRTLRVLHAESSSSERTILLCAFKGWLIANCARCDRSSLDLFN